MISQHFRAKLPHWMDQALVYTYYWRSWALSGERELRILRHLVAPGRMAIDVGANAGVYSYHMRRITDQVLAFEPNPLLAARLCVMLPRVTVEQVALSAKHEATRLRIPFVAGRVDTGMASLEVQAVPSGQLANAIDVKAAPLDSYELDNVGFVKIDVEGHEEAVLIGAEKTLRSNLPNLLIEIEERHNPGGLFRIRERLTRLGYKGYFLDKDNFVPLDRFSMKTHQDATLFKHSRKRRAVQYVNNFVFTATSNERFARIPKWGAN